MNYFLLTKTIFSLLLMCSLYISGYAATPARATSTFSYEPDSVRKVLEQEQRATFNHFWQFANKQTGMIHASANVNNKNLTTGGSGFGVMVILTGIERGWISRRSGRQTYPVLSTLSQQGRPYQRRMVALDERGR